MPDIVLTESQAHEFSHAREKVILRDPKGDMIGVIDPLDAIALANHRKRAGHPKEPGIPAERVEEYMDALQAEWDRLGGFDEVYMEAFLARMQDGELK